MDSLQNPAKEQFPPSANDIPSSVTVSNSTAALPNTEAHKAKNIYPILRHMILVIFVLICLCLIFFLIHQNGRSIYENGV